MSNKERYRNFCEEEKDLPLFFQPWYLDALGDEETWEVVLVEKKGRVFGAMPFFVKKKAGFKYVTMPVFARYMGPFLIEEKRNINSHHQICKALIEQLPPFDDFSMYCQPDFGSWLPFHWNGFDQTTRYTYQLDVSNLDITYDNLNRNIKRHLKSIEKQEITVVRGITLETYYEVNKKTYERQNIDIDFSFAAFQKLDRAMSEKKQREIFAARDEEGNIHSVIYLVWDNKTAYFLLGGSDPKFRKSNAATLLAWEAIVFIHRELQLSQFDFCGSMVEGIEANRRMFRGTPIAYHHITKTPSFLMKCFRFLQK